MPKTLIENLIRFREQRTEKEILKATGLIADAKISREMFDDLKIILNSSGENRIKALQKLMVTIGGSGGSRHGIIQALSFLTNESGYKDNPFLLIALAKTSIYQSDSPSIGSTQYDSSRISKAVLAANYSCYSTSSKSGITKLDRTEAAAINRFASDLYREIGLAADSNHVDWIARYQSMPIAERNGYDEDDLIPLYPPNQNVVRLQSIPEMNLQKSREDYIAQNETWAEQDKIGSELPSTDHRTSEYFQKGSDTYELDGGFAKKKMRGTNKGYQPKLELVLKPNDEKTPYAKSNFMADGYGAIFGLYLEAAKWNKFSLRMSVITSYINEKERLERQIRNERLRLKPPPPEATLNHIKEFRRYGRITADPNQRRRIIATINQLYILLEEGQAFYK